MVHIYEHWVAYEKFRLEPRGRGHVIGILVHFYLCKYSLQSNNIASRGAKGGCPPYNFRRYSIYLLVMLTVP